MKNLAKNGRNYKNNIIKLSLNSFSTNSAIHDNFSSINSKKLKNFEKNRKINEPNISKAFPSEKTSNISENKKSYNNGNNKNSINKESIKTVHKNSINSQKNLIILLSSYSLKEIPKKKGKNVIKNNLQNNKPNNKNIHNELYSKINNSGEKKLKNNEKEECHRSKKLICDIFKEFNKQKKSPNKNNRNKYIELMQMNSIQYTKDNQDNKSSIKSSKFINFDIIDEKISFIDGLDVMNLYDKKNNNKNQQQKDSQNENNYEMEFEDYIKKLNLEEVNIDKELLERPLYYKNIIKFGKNSEKKINDNCKCSYNSAKPQNLNYLNNNKNTKLNKDNNYNNKEKIKFNFDKKFNNYKNNNKLYYSVKSKEKNKNKIKNNNICNYLYCTQSRRNINFNEKKKYINIS